MQYAAAMLSFAAAAVAIVGGSTDGHLSPSSWVALVIAVCSLSASVVLTRRSQSELRARRLRESRLKATAVREVDAGLGQLERVLNYALFASRHNVRGTPTRASAKGRFVPASLEELASDELAAELATLQLTPRRSIGGPWTQRVPYGTDHRTLDQLIATESEDAFARLDQAVAKYVEVLDAALVEQISSLTGHPFATHLRGLPDLVDRRITIEDSVYATVGLINNYSGKPDQYARFVDLLVEVDRLTASERTAAGRVLDQAVAVP